MIKELRICKDKGSFQTKANLLRQQKKEHGMWKIFQKTLKKTINHLNL